MFGNCSTCCGPSALRCLSVVRFIGGFHEYFATHTKTNPLTWFYGRRYKRAEFVVDLAQGATVSCSEGGSQTATVAPPCVDSQTYTFYSTLSDFINAPGSGYSGTWCVSGFPGLYADYGFQADGYYSATGGGSDPMSLPCNSANDLVFGAYPSYGDPPKFNCLPEPDNSHCAPYGVGSISTSETETGAGYQDSGWIIDSATNAHDTVTMDCVLSQNITYGCGNGPVFSVDFPGWTTNTASYTLSNTVALSHEVDYEAVAGSVLDGIETAKGYDVSGCPECVQRYGFNDYPGATTGSWSADPSPYDGALTPISALTFATPTYEVDTSNCAAGWAIDRTTLFLTCCRFSATFYEIHPENGVWIVGLASQDYVTDPYILADFFVMNDGSLVAVELGDGSGFANCRDGTTFGTIWIPQPPTPSMLGAGWQAAFEDSFGEDGDGNLIGPIGMITVCIKGVTCDTWDHTFPS